MGAKTIVAQNLVLPDLADVPAALQSGPRAGRIGRAADYPIVAKYPLEAVRQSDNLATAMVSDVTGAISLKRSATRCRSRATR
ncbi:MAG: hypothetical protein MJE77_26805 [Proteobacteria bacterium]|nr:hypothetical protein [Pseudomonadota bacterium]